MLFLYRPRQTWMPYGPPRRRTDQDGYNRELQESFAATHRVEPQAPSPHRDVVKDLKELASLRESGVLTDAELQAAKAKVLQSEDLQSEDLPPEDLHAKEQP